ncbi:ABC transporter ATP-binding protein [Youxingia wuxianensis]|uniref:ABC transporter ATP-binding protein n=1 Tax=Youxingia wuxianensis TaxID=2763678 RepID=A0A926EQM7_9FIRM|nr:ABC transporter ATP-binding protein [Youxingia wuxianensis]MBC8584515.1 ABC transporter ATP-binding protein [Youxingia wuxianensis]
MLKVQGLVSGYGKVQIIRGVDIEISSGEIVSIIGRNGVGKTTLMKTIMGAIRPMAGKIEIDGKDFTKKPIYTRAADGVGYVEQGHGIFPALTVEENLKIGLGINNMKKSKDLSIAHEYFPILLSRSKQKAGTLSGGEQAMLSIARVLVAKPRIILLDEPSEGVQPNVVNQIGEIISKFSKEMNITILLVEQHLKLIQSISQRAYALDKGVIVGNLTREELLDNDTVASYLTV